ncbi:MAG TPA: phosphatase PAP2 family protein [Alphaproteobacteria bacterium]
MSSHASFIVIVTAFTTVLFLAVLHRSAWCLVGIAQRAAVRIAGGSLAMRLMAHARPIGAVVAVRAPGLYAVLVARTRTDRFTGLPLTLIVCAAAYVAFLFGGLIEELLEADEVVWFDMAVNRALDGARIQPFLGAFLWITKMGEGPAVTAVCFAATAFLALERRWRFVPGLWTTMIGAQVTTWIGKYAIGRDRPEFLEIVTADSPAFPSGHATAAMAVYGFLAYTMLRRMKGLRARFEIVFWTAILIGIIGFSRIYLRVHYVSDVASGFLVGIFWLLVGVVVAEWSRGRAPGISGPDERAPRGPAPP